MRSSGPGFPARWAGPGRLPVIPSPRQSGMMGFAVHWPVGSITRDDHATTGVMKQARIEVGKWIEDRYNRRRRHASIGRISPWTSNCNTHARTRTPKSRITAL